MRVVLLGYLAWNDLASEFVQPAQETPDLAVAVSLIEVVRPEVSVGDPIAEHEIRGGQHGGCNRQDWFSTGGRPKLVGITKRGSKYLRKMLIQGARATMPTLRQSDTRLGQWLRGLLARAHANTAVVALAAKMARIVWALLRACSGRT